MTKINLKISKGKIVLAVFLAIIIGIGVYGTFLGIKDTVEQKEKEEQYLQTTTEEFVLSAEEKEFSCDKFSITLTEDFEVFEDSAIEVGAVCEGIEVFVLADEFENDSKISEMSPEEYVQELAQSDETVEIKQYNGIPYAEYVYRGEDNGILKEYKVFCYKGENCFWMLHFITNTKYLNRYESHIFEWIETVDAK